MRILLLHITLEIKGGADAHVQYLYKELPKFGISTFLISINQVDKWEDLKSADSEIDLRVRFNDVFEIVLGYALRNKISVIHVHSGISVYLIEKLSTYFPIIRTLHNAALTCVSGEKFLLNAQIPCCKPLNAGCFKNAYTQRCASTRMPLKLFKRFSQVVFEKSKANSLYKFIISPSKYIAGLCIDEGVDPNLVKVIPYPYSPPDLPISIQPENQYLKIVFSGRLTFVKGVTLIHDIVFPILSKNKSIQLHILGTGPLEKLLKENIHNSIKDQIVFHGWLNQTEIQEQYRQADIFLIPSIYPDNFPIVCIEALFYGKPILVFDSGGLPEMVEDGVNGFVIPLKDVSTMTSKLNLLINNSELRNKMGIKSKQIFLEKYDKDVVVPKILRLYELAINKYDK